MNTAQQIVAGRQMLERAAARAAITSPENLPALVATAINSGLTIAFHVAGVAVHDEYSNEVAFLDEFEPAWSTYDGESFETLAEAIAHYREARGLQ